MSDNTAILKDLKHWSAPIISSLSPIEALEYERSRIILEDYAQRYLRIAYDREVLLNDFRLTRKMGIIGSIIVFLAYNTLWYFGVFADYSLQDVMLLLAICSIPSLNDFYLLNSFDRSTGDLHNTLNSFLVLAFIDPTSARHYTSLYKADSGSIATKTCREIILNDTLDIITNRKYSHTQPSYSVSSVFDL